MADIELVIKIPEHVYEHIKEVYEHSHTVEATYSYIYNGTQLPKGHGKIIDVSDLLYRICLDDTEESREYNVGEIITLEDIDSIPAIIKADTESEV